MRKRNTLLLGGGLLAVALAFAPGTAGIGSAAWAEPAPTAGLDYVALGDSYAAGLGLPNPTGTVPGCGQSTSSYPQQVALALGLSLTDVTCSGANTFNILNTEQVTGAGTNPVQIGALTTDTDIVTVTIGGNDLGFSTIIGACLAASANGPTLNNPVPADPQPLNCKSFLAPDGGFDSLAAKIAALVAPSLTATLTAINAAAPNAKVFVVAYPALMPDQAHTPASECYASAPMPFPFTITDVKYLHGIQAQLDAALNGAAGAAGATFVPMFASTLGNTPCANNLNAFINGVIPSPAAMHPNAAGANFMTANVKAAIEAALAAPTITPTSASIGVPVGVPASLSFAATGFPTPTWSISGDLPAGVAFDTATGVLSGTPSATGISSFSITATNTVGSATENFTVTVVEAPVITSAAPPSPGTVGEPYSFTVTASGFPAPLLALNGILPDGLTFTPGTGVITGTPTTQGTSTFSVTATNAAGSATSAEYTIVVNPAAVAPKITSSAPPAAKLGTAYSFKVLATGFPAPTFAVTAGALPKGLTLDAVSGAISGTPTEAGKFAFSITASNATEPAATVRYAIEVTKAATGTPGTPPAAGLASTGSASFLSMGIAGGVLLLSGAGLLATRRMVKG